MGWSRRSQKLGERGEYTGVRVRAVDSIFQELKKRGKRSRSTTLAGDGAVKSLSRGKRRSRSSGVEAFMILSMSEE
jgi:hypothetical protein